MNKLIAAAKKEKLSNEELIHNILKASLDEWGIKLSKYFLQVFDKDDNGVDCET